MLIRQERGIQVLTSTAFYPMPHATDPWARLGDQLPTLTEVPGAVSVDLGMSTNKYPPGMDLTFLFFLVCQIRGTSLKLPRSAYRSYSEKG